MTYTIRPSDSSWRRPGLSSQGAVCFLEEGGRTLERATTPAQRLSLFSQGERALREVPPLRDRPASGSSGRVRGPTCSPPAPHNAGFRASSPISSRSSQPFSPLLELLAPATVHATVPPVSFRDHVRTPSCSLLRARGFPRAPQAGVALSQCTPPALHLFRYEALIPWFLAGGGGVERR